MGSQTRESGGPGKAQACGTASVSRAAHPCRAAMQLPAGTEFHSVGSEPPVTAREGSGLESGLILTTGFQYPGYIKNGGKGIFPPSRSKQLVTHT